MKKKPKPAGESLLSRAEEPARDELRRLGWTQLPLPGGAVWRQPFTQNLYSEAEALVILDNIHKTRR